MRVPGLGPQRQMLPPTGRAKSKRSLSPPVHFAQRGMFGRFASDPRPNLRQIRNAARGLLTRGRSDRRVVIWRLDWCEVFRSLREGGPTNETPARARPRCHERSTDAGGFGSVFSSPSEETVTLALSARRQLDRARDLRTLCPVGGGISSCDSSTDAGSISKRRNIDALTSREARRRHLHPLISRFSSGSMKSRRARARRESLRPCACRIETASGGAR